MTIRNLEYLFKPASVAVVGVSRQVGSPGLTVLRNLIDGEFPGPIMPVAAEARAVAGVLAYPDVDSLPVTPELAFICTPAQEVPGQVEKLGRRGTRAAIVNSHRLRQTTGDDGRTLQQAALDAARPYLMRILGPSSVGVAVPHLGLHANTLHLHVRPGSIALVHQSSAVSGAVLDWADSAGIGFSHVIGLGDGADVDFGDVVDYLANDPAAGTIMLYMEGLTEARKFMSAARAASRNKPLVVVKAGRVEESARAAESHAGALAGADAVYDAAFRRAGMLRGVDTSEMMQAVRTLSYVRQFAGDRLAVLTNGGGPGIIATDALVLGGGRLAELDAETRARLDSALAPAWSHDNPVDISNSADGERYAAALGTLRAAPEVDAVLVIYAPGSGSTAEEIARVVARAVAEGDGEALVLAVWMGGARPRAAQRYLREAGIATYDTPEQAVRAFLHMVGYRRNQETLMETPVSLPAEVRPAREAARLVIQGAMSAGREVLSEPEAMAVLAAYGVPVVETHICKTPEAAAALARRVGFPVALKLLCPALAHKSEVGGVTLDLQRSEDVERAARAMVNRLKELRPDTGCEGFTVQAMARRPGGHELIVGATTDPVFGPVIVFGQGGTGVELIGDRAVGLPPLNMKLAKDMVLQTRVARLLEGYRDRAPVNMDALCLALVQVAHMVAEIPEIVAVDVNPVLANEQGIVALDAHMRVAPARVSAAARLAIRAYPKELEERVSLGGRPVVLRPIRPEDEPLHRAFFDTFSEEDIRFRFFGPLGEVSHARLARYTQIDYDREMAFIAVGEDEQGQPCTLGVVRAVTDPDNHEAKFAIILSAAIKGMGLGRILVEKMIRYTRERGTDALVGQALSDNGRMRALARRLGFTERQVSGEDIVEVRLGLQAAGGRLD